MSQTLFSNRSARNWKPQQLEAFWIVRFRIALDTLPFDNSAKINLAHQLEAHAAAQVHHARIRGHCEHPRGARGAAHRYAALEQPTR